MNASNRVESATNHIMNVTIRCFYATDSGIHASTHGVQAMTRCMDISNRRMHIPNRSMRTPIRGICDRDRFSDLSCRHREAEPHQSRRRRASSQARPRARRRSGSRPLKSTSIRIDRPDTRNFPFLNRIAVAAQAHRPGDICRRDGHAAPQRGPGQELQAWAGQSIIISSPFAWPASIPPLMREPAWWRDPRPWPGPSPAPGRR